MHAKQKNCYGINLENYIYKYIYLLLLSLLCYDFFINNATLVIDVHVCSIINMCERGFINIPAIH